MKSSARSVRMPVPALLLILSCTLIGAPASASVIYDWACTDANCNGDPAFTATLTLSDAAVASGDFTGVTGNIESWTTTSGIGAGFTLTLADISTSIFDVLDDFDTVRMVLSADRSVIESLFDSSAGSNMSFVGAGGVRPRADYFESPPGGGAYSVGSLQDANGVFGSIGIAGQFVRRVVVPAPAGAALLMVGLAAVAGAQRPLAGPSPGA